jgi:hypothetical protein
LGSGFGAAFCSGLGAGFGAAFAAGLFFAGAFAFGAAFAAVALDLVVFALGAAFSSAAAASFATPVVFFVGIDTSLFEAFTIMPRQ